VTALAAAPPAGGRYLPAAGSGADRAIRVSTAAVVLAVAGIAAYISYWHAYAVVREYGETGVTARLEPATIDGLVYASSMVPASRPASRSPSASSRRCSARPPGAGRAAGWPRPAWNRYQPEGSHG
jgi:hypothetical protein